MGGERGGAAGQRVLGEAVRLLARVSVGGTPPPGGQAENYKLVSCLYSIDLKPLERVAIIMGWDPSF